MKKKISSSRANPASQGEKLKNVKQTGLTKGLEKGSINIDEIRIVLELMKANGVSDFAWESGTQKLSLKTGERISVIPGMVSNGAFSSQNFEKAPENLSREGSREVEKKPETRKNSKEITSPFVGTFYRAASPDAPKYVDVGSVVDVGQTLCIVEAMKLMNEIESDIRGKIVSILVENGDPVEFGQPLFLVEI